MASLLDVLPEYVLHWMVQNGTERTLQANDILLHEGVVNTSLYIVLDGVFAVSLHAESGGNIDHAGPGSMLGETSFFNGAAEPATVYATEPSLVLEIRKSQFESKLAHDHVYASDLYKALLRTMSVKLQRATVRILASERSAQEATTTLPEVERARNAIATFKGILVGLDKEAMKSGGVSEEKYQQFFTQATDLMLVCHSVLGDGSPLSESVRAHLGASLQAEMLPYVLTTETADRFYSKPRGYAGDYVAIHRIYMNQPGGSSRMGPIVDRMFLETPPSVAVRNRRHLLAGEIVKSVRSKEGGPTRVLCLASGPATEVFDAFAALEDKTMMKATLMDIDLQALAFVDEQRTRNKLNGQISLVNENLIAMFLGRSTVQFEPQDLIYSIGLTDYLNDKLFGKLLRFAHQNLAEGGRILLGNFHPRNPAKEFMDHVLEWNLIHRTEDDMHRLFSASPFARGCTSIQFEEQGVNLFAECIKKEEAAHAAA